jgi:nitroimidazol reductase NimA-like FMN-containing flavoprotein (pyridoxamine 5'-phosphate oxidase superfamily)
MTKDNTSMRRKDRMVTDDTWIKDMLRFEQFCTVASAQDNQPFLRPSAFCYVEADHAIYIHGAHNGRAIDNMAENNKVCLGVFAVGPMRSDKRAFDFLQEHAGVIVFGVASVVTDNAKKHAVMQATFTKHAPHLTARVDYEPASQDEIDETTIIRIDITNWSGKMKWTDEPGRERFWFDDVRGDARPALPWVDNMDDDAGLTAEWRASQHKKDSP